VLIIFFYFFFLKVKHEIFHFRRRYATFYLLYETPGV